MQNLFRKNIFSSIGLLNGKLSLRIKLTIAAVGVSVLFLVPLTFYNYQNTRTQLTQSVSNNLRSVAQVQAAAIGDLLSRQVNLLQSLGGSKTLQDMVIACNTAHCGDPNVETDLPVLEAEWQSANAAHSDNDPLVQSVINNPGATDIITFRETFPDNLEVIATDQYGLVLAASNRTAHYSYADEIWWRKAYNNGRGAIYIGQPELITSINRYAIVIAVPMYSSGTRQVIGVLYSAVGLLPHRDLLASTQIGKTSEAVLLFRGSELLDSSGLLRNWPSSTVVQIANAGESEVMQMRLDQSNVLYMVSQAPISSSDPILGPVIFTLKWHVVVSIEPSEALAPVNATALNNFLIGLAILSMSLLLVLALTQYLTGPITRLTAIAEQVRAGDLRSRAKVESQDEIGVLAQTFNQMTAQLSNQINTLEQSVAERTRDLERQALRLRTAAEVARDAASAPSLGELLDQASRLIWDRFNFYHAGIFLLDENNEYAVLRASPTEAGRQMLENNHRLKIGEQGIVGLVAFTGEPRVALDVGADSVHFDNPLLPDTRSEMALPLKTTQGVIGVLDVQSDQSEAFTQEDIAILQVMADQLATAIERTRLLQQSENNLKELEQAYSEFTQKSWSSFASGERYVSGYRYNNIRLEPIREVPKEAKETLEKGIIVTSDNKSHSQTASIPIRLRGQTIGVVNIRFQGNYAPQETINMVEQAADRLATALENARLLEETRQRAQRDALISDMTGHLRSTLDLETVLKTAAQELQKAFNLQEAEVRLGLGNKTESAPESSNQKKDGRRRN